MFFRVFFCVVVFAITVSAQPPTWAPPPSKVSPVTVAVSPDGNLLAIARGNSGASKRYGRVEVWNLQTGELERTITGFDGPVWSLTFSRDGEEIITASTEYREAKIQSSVRDLKAEKITGELKWWNTQTGEFIKKLPVADEGVISLEATWAPAGDLIALVERRSQLQLTQFSEVDIFGQRRVYPRFAGYQETELRLLDAQTGERRVKLEDAHKTHPGDLARVYVRLERPVFSSDGTKVAALTGEHASIWDVASGKIVRLKKLTGWPTAIAFSEDSRTLAVASVKGGMPGGESEITIWNAATGQQLNKLKGRNDAIACLQFAAQGRALLIGSLRYEPDGPVGTVKMWDLRDNRLGRLKVQGDQAISAMTVIPSQNAVVLQSGSNVELRDVKTFDVRYTFAPTETEDDESMRRSRFLLSANRALAVAFSADGKTVSAEIPGEGIRVWDVRTGALKNRIPREESADGELTTVANGGLIAEVSTPEQTGQIAIRDANTRAVSRTIDAGQKITAVAVDASGRLLAAARADYSIGVWDLKTGALQGELRKHQNTINALAFSPDGQTLASGGDDRTVILWDVATSRPKHTLKGHDVTVTSLAFSPDGQTLATGSGNAAVILWNVASAKLDRILR